MEVLQFPSGFSNLTYLVNFGSRELVLRRPPFGRKAETAHDMKTAIDQHGGLKSVQAAVVQLGEDSNVKMPKWPGIQQLNNFRYNDTLLFITS